MRFEIVWTAVLLVMCPPAAANPPPGVMFCGRIPGTAHVDVVINDDRNQNATTLRLFMHVYEQAGQKEIFVDCPAVGYAFDQASGALSLSGPCAEDAKRVAGSTLITRWLGEGDMTISTKWGNVALPRGTCVNQQAGQAVWQGGVTTNQTSLATANHDTCEFNEFQYGGTSRRVPGTCGGYDYGSPCISSPCKTCVGGGKLKFLDGSVVISVEGTSTHGSEYYTELPTGSIFNPETCNVVQVRHLITCPRVSAELPRGRWIPTTFFDHAGTISVAYGTETSTTFTTEEQHSWSNSVETSIKAGFAADIFSGGVSVTVTNTEAQSISQSMSSSLAESTMKTYTYPMPRAGQVWQWQMLIEDTCGLSKSIGYQAAVTTNSRVEFPCCLPGYFKDPSNPRGACLDGSTSFCRQTKTWEVLYE